MHRIGGSIALVLAVLSVGIHVVAVAGTNLAADWPVVWGLFASGIGFTWWMLRIMQREGWRSPHDVLEPLPRWSRVLTWLLVLYLGGHVLVAAWQELSEPPPQRVSGIFRVIDQDKSGHRLLMDDHETHLGVLESALRRVRVEGLPVRVEARNFMLTTYQETSEFEYNWRHNVLLRLASAGWVILHLVPGTFLASGRTAKKKRKRPAEATMPAYPFHRSS